MNQEVLNSLEESLALDLRLSVVAFEKNSLFQTQTKTSNETCSRQLKSIQVISVQTNLVLASVNNSLVNIIFNQIEVFIFFIYFFSKKFLYFLF